MKLRALTLLMLCSPLFGAYTYYVTDPLWTINTGQWIQNGSVTAITGKGLTSSTAGSLISSVTVPTPSAFHEVKLTLSIPNAGGSYVAYLRASTNALLTQTTATGTFYAVQVSPNNGTCALSILKVISGTVTTLASTSVGGCSDGTVIRTVPQANTAIVVFVNNVQTLWAFDSSIAAGQPGVGMIAGGGNAIARTELGQFDSTPPNAPSSGGIAALAAPNRIELEWQGASDDPNGMGCIRIGSIAMGCSYFGKRPDTTAGSQPISISAGPKVFGPALHGWLDVLHTLSQAR